MLVSIIVPVYNVVLENFKCCMDSLQNQTLKDIEIILVDDRGEMRECVEYAKQIAETDCRVRILVNEANSGAGYSRNRGIAEAKGEYLAFVDADDAVDLDFYEKLYEKSKEKKYDIIKGELKGEKSPLNVKIRAGLMQGKPLYELFNYHHWTAIYRGEFVKKNEIGYGSSRVSQDVTFLLKVTLLARSFATVDGAYYHYDRENTNSLTHTSLVENISHYCQAIQERMDFLTQYADYNDPAFLRYVEFNTGRLSARVKMLTDSEVTSDKCKVSVIIPTYNSEEYLENLITQLCEQTLSDIELLFVDDGSTDKSSDIINEAMKEDGRISYYYQSNSGAGVARNTGLNHAKGKYVICIDTDDLYDNNMLEEMYEAAEASQADAVMCLFRRRNYWTDEETENEGYRKDKLPLERIFCGKEVEKFCEWFNPGPINKLYRRKFVMENGLRYSSTRIANDVLFGYGAMMLAQRIYCLPKNLLTVCRYVNENSISSTRQMYLEQSIQAIDGLWSWAKQKGIMDGDIQKQLTKIFVNSTLYNCQYGENNKFWKECCTFIKKMNEEGVSIDSIQRMFNIDTQKIQDRITELKQNPKKDKEVVMLGNKIAFVEQMKNYLSSVKEISVKEIKKEPLAKPNKPEEKNTEVKNIVKPQATAPMSLKSSVILKIKLALARLWPVSIRRFNVENYETRKLIRKGFKDNQNQFSLLKRDNQKRFLSLEKEIQNHSSLQKKELQRLVTELEQENKELQKQISEMQKSMFSGQQMLLEKCDTLLANQQNHVKILENVNEVKLCVENNTRVSMEGVWAEVFNSTTYNSSWLLDKTFSPGRWAVGYQCLYAMYRVLDEVKPKRILELGLGQSTRMISQYAAAHEGVEHIVVEHDANWADFFKNSYTMPECSRIEVCDLEMVSYKDADEVRVYKDLAERLEGMKFDFIVIDAPRGGDMKKYARIDVLRMMPECLSENFVILVDDFNRSGEKQTVREMDALLREKGIPFKRGKYAGMKDCILLCAESLKFLATM